MKEETEMKKDKGETKGKEVRSQTVRLRFATMYTASLQPGTEGRTEILLGLFHLEAEEEEDERPRGFIKEFVD